jgi:putative intracellular protease/amidase
VSHKNLNPSVPGHPTRVAMVLSNPAVSSTTGWPVGFWWADLTHPYFTFTEAGYEVELFSPLGRPCKADAMSDPRTPAAGKQRTLTVDTRCQTVDPTLLQRTVPGRGADSALARQPEEETVREGGA